MRHVPPARIARLALFTLLCCQAASPAQAQTSLAATPSDTLTVNGTTINQTFSGGALNLVNTGGAISNGGLFAAASSALTQAATNSLNTYGLAPGALAALPVLGGAGQVVTLNMLASGSAPTSLTISNTNFAANSGINTIPGASAAANAPWLGGFGAAGGGGVAGGQQSGGNAANAAVISLAPGTVFNLSQTGNAGAGGNFSVVNTLGALGATGPAIVGGFAAATSGAPGFAAATPVTPSFAALQTANSALNTATTIGAAAINVQQL